MFFPQPKSVQDGGHMEAVEGSFVPEALFYLEDPWPFTWMSQKVCKRLVSNKLVITYNPNIPHLYIG